MRVIVLILLVLLIPSVHAIAVASDFLERNTLQLIEETSTIYSIRLQNPDNVESRVKLSYSENYMEGLDVKEFYTLPPKSSTRLEFNVTAPKYNKENNIYIISFSVQQLGGSGILLPGISKSIKLEVIKDSDKFRINYFHLAVIIILLIIIFFLLKRKPK